MKFQASYTALIGREGIHLPFSTFAAGQGILLDLPVLAFVPHLTASVPHITPHTPGRVQLLARLPPMKTKC